MNENQLLILALATVPAMAVVLAGILVNNARMNDLRSGMSARMGDIQTGINARLNVLCDVLRAEMARNHSELLMKFADLDRRITHIETSLA